MSALIKFLETVYAAAGTYLQEAKGAAQPQPAPLPMPSSTYAIPQPTVPAPSVYVQPSPQPAQAQPPTGYLPPPTQPTAPVPAAQPSAEALPKVVSAGDIHLMRRTTLDRMIDERRWGIPHGPEVKLTDLKKAVVDFLNAQNAPSGMVQSNLPLPAIPAASAMPPAIAPVALPAPAQVAPAPFTPPIPAPALSALPTVYVPPGAIAPVTSVPPVSVQQPPDVRPGKIEAFKAWLRAHLVSQNGEVYAHWTEPQYKMAVELEAFMNNVNGGLLVGPAVPAAEKAAGQAYVTGMGCAGKCATGCPYGPGQPAYCYAVFDDTNPSISYSEAAAKGWYFKVQPSPTPTQGELAVLAYTPMNGQ